MPTGFVRRKLPTGRVMINDFLELADWDCHSQMNSLVDVGKILEYLESQAKGGLQIPLAAAMLKGLGLVVRQHPEARTFHYQLPPRQVCFDLCSATFPVERDIDGQKVPFFVHIKDCDRRTIRDIAFEIKRYRKAPMEEIPEIGSMLGAASLPKLVRRALYLPFIHLPFLRPLSGGTFGFAELDVGGVDDYTPVATETVTFGIGAVKDRPVAGNSTVAVRKTVSLSMIFDRRVIDDKAAEKFFGDCVRTLEEAAFVKDG
jgi:hypothetical protein